MFTLPAQSREELLAHASEFVNRAVPYQFTETESRALHSFFTNLDRRVFLLYGLPSNIQTALCAMYSRLKNKRGVRGIFVDSFLPAILAGMLDVVQGADFNGDAMAFLKKERIASLDDFVKRSDGAAAFEEFCRCISMNPSYIASFTSSKRVRGFLQTWLDKYGHNSIARMGFVTICMERISILAAKSVEWARPGAGYIELSTRFVDMNGAETYDIGKELEIMEVDAEPALNLAKHCFDRYAALSGGEEFNGPFPAFLRARYEAMYADDPAGLTTGIIGETCDVLGNLLPASTLTSVCAGASGEALSSILKHLLLDGTPENHALAEAILKETEKIGANQFCRHYEPTEGDRRGWQYLSHEKYYPNPVNFLHPENKMFWNPIQTAFQLKEGFEHKVMDDIVVELFHGKRLDHDKLPREFELAQAVFCGKMSFRGWRDLHRQGLSTHRRTLLTPHLGFYEYDKPHAPELDPAFQKIAQEARRAWDALDAVPPFMRQYILPLGFNVGYIFGCNLRQLEFCLWQRTDWSVNHEVREVFLGMERRMCDVHDWWKLVSRADREPAYVFARGKKPLPLALSKTS